jgi:hypothetical protein
MHFKQLHLRSQIPLIHLIIGFLHIVISKLLQELIKLYTFRRGNLDASQDLPKVYSNSERMRTL